MAKKEKFNLSTTQGLNVDYRSDTTRQGFNERGVYKGAINVQRSPLDALDILLAQGQEWDERSYNYKPGTIAPIIGIAPTPSLKKLSTFIGPNGQTYVKLANGKVQTLTNYNRKIDAAITGSTYKPISKEAQSVGAKSEAHYKWLTKKPSDNKVIIKKNNKVQDDINIKHNTAKNLKFVPGGRSKYKNGGNIDYNILLLD